MNKRTNTGGVANVNTTEDRNYFKNKHLNILNSKHRWVRNKEGRYFVNQYGDVFSCVRKHTKKLATQPNGSPNKYPKLALDGHHHSVHKLMLIAWIGLPPSPKHEACHMDDDPNNNTISNLHWGLRGSKFDLKTLRNDPAQVDDFCEEAAKLYLNPTNLLEASFKKAMYAQWEIIKSHRADCSCRLCSIGMDAIPLDIRDEVLAIIDPVKP